MKSLIEKLAEFRIGEITSVSPTRFDARLAHEAPQGVALNTGEPLLFPKINSFVLVPTDGLTVVGQISFLGIRSEHFVPKRNDPTLVPLVQPSRVIEITPIGTLVKWSKGKRDGYELSRGIDRFPSIGDPVNLPSSQQLKSLVESPSEDDRLEIGSAVHAIGASVRVNPDKIFGRHLAVLGNTGSGKSCSVASLIRTSVTAAATARGKNPNSRFIVLDPNGEYAEAFKDLPGCKILKPEPSENESPFYLPAWMWNSQEWFAFARAQAGAQQPILLKALRDLRSGASSQPEDPIGPFRRILRNFQQLLNHAIQTEDYAKFPQCCSVHNCLQSMGQRLNEFPTDHEKSADVQALAKQAQDASEQFTNGRYQNPFDYNAIRTVADAIAALNLTSASSIETDAPFEDLPKEFSVKSLPDYLEALTLTDEFSRSADFVGFMRNRIRYSLLNERLKPITAPSSAITLQEWLETYLGKEDETKLVIVDLSLVPADVLHLMVAVFARLILEALQRHRKTHKCELPTVLVMEEAHNFITRGRADSDSISPRDSCREIFDKIAREGRKFGLGLVISSQRPSELSPTVLAQCNTFLLHRLVNDEDQTLVRKLVPDTLGSLLKELSNLPSRQAVLLGWATPIPVLTEMHFLEKAHRPMSEDPKFWNTWVGDESTYTDWKTVIDGWIGSEMPTAPQVPRAPSTPEPSA
jgi:uncharacterized protein